MEPKIVTRPAFVVAGVKYRGKNENDEIPRLWRESYQRLIENPSSKMYIYVPIKPEENS